jgi:DNA polymerase-3 subunit delta'
VQLADQFDGLAKENQKGILSYSLHIFRQCLYQISDASNLIKSLEKEKAFVDNFSKTLNTDKIAAMTEKISEVHYHLERYARAKMVHLDLSLHLLRVVHAKNS